MGQGGLDDGGRERRAFGRPVAEGRSEAVRNGGDAEVANGLADGAVHHPFAPDGGKEQLVGGEPRSRVENGDGGGAERDAVLDAGLHTRTRNRPQRARAVDFGPGRASHLAASSGREDEEAERELRACPDVGGIDRSEGTCDVLVGKGWVALLALRIAAAVGKGRFGGVDGIVGAVALGEREVEHGREAVPHPKPGLALGVPEGGEGFDAIGAGDLVDPLVHQGGGVGVQCASPFACGAFGIAPSGGVALDDGVEHFVDGRSIAGLAPRILAGANKARVGESLASGVREGDGRVAAETEIHGAAIDVHALIPLFGSTRLHGERQTVSAAAIAIGFHAAGGLDGGYESGGE